MNASVYVALRHARFTRTNGTTRRKAGACTYLHRFRRAPSFAAASSPVATGTYVARSRTRIALAVGATLVFAVMLAQPARAQTDYYNLDKNRPTRVEDAFTTKRYAFELKAVPLALLGHPDGTASYRPQIEFKHGLLPGFDFDAGVSVPLSPLTGDVETGDAQLEFSTMLNATVETRYLPALGVRATAHAVPAADDALSYELKGMATRTVVRYVRLHANGALGLGDGRHEDWWAGAALDYAMPFRALLLIVSGHAAQMNSDVFGPAADDLRWHTEAGIRYQISHTLGLDAGIGRSWTGPGGPEWTLGLGLTHEFGIRALIPTRRR